MGYSVILMKTETAAILETAFISTETFTQKAFKRWVERYSIKDVYHYELIDGRIVMTPPASWEHAEIGAKVVRILGNFVEKYNLGRVFDSSAGYDLPSGDTLEPDASFVSHDSWAKASQVRRDQFLKVPPNLVVEILFPATAKRDRTEKRRIYETNGVDEYWIVDPDKREVTIFHLVEGQYDAGERFSTRQKLRSRVLPGLEVPARTLFARE
ncbi:MAG TPA: Uma2 family endonuclease [Thermodesulfobacteriota bacterium]|nr:Uma2 family endonuclease [Thermodesulfobacteriota bacterium]